MKIEHAQTAVDSHAQSGDTGMFDQKRCFEAISPFRPARDGEVDGTRCRRGICRFPCPGNRGESIPSCARLVLTGHKVNRPMRLSASKFTGGAVEDSNPPHCLVDGLSKRYQRRHQRKRRSNGFHPHNHSTQRPGRPPLHNFPTGIRKAHEPIIMGKAARIHAEQGLWLSKPSKCLSGWELCFLSEILHRCSLFLRHSLPLCPSYSVLERCLS